MFVEGVAEVLNHYRCCFEFGGYLRACFGGCGKG